MIEFHQVAKTWRGQPGLRSVSFRVPTRNITVVTGAPDAGKTTLLSLPNRLIEPSSGEITYDDRPLTAYKKRDLRRRFGWAGGPQGLFPAKTVLDNIALMPRLLEWPEHTSRARAYEALEAVRLPRCVAAKRPDQLTVAERVRIDLARAVAGEPQLMLVDDPFGHVDDVAARELVGLIKELAQKWCSTWLIATRNTALAVELADQLAVLDDGRLVQSGSVAAVVDNPTEQVRRIIGDERGLLSLSLIPAAGLAMDSARTVRDPAAVPPGCLGLVLDRQGRPTGWVQASDDDWMDLGYGVPFDPRTDSMRDALEAVLTSPISQGVAIDHATGRYRGIVGADAVLERAARHRVTVTNRELARRRAAADPEPVDVADAGELAATPEDADDAGQPADAAQESAGHEESQDRESS